LYDRIMSRVTDDVRWATYTVMCNRCTVAASHHDGAYARFFSASMLACTGRYVEVPLGASCRGLLDSDTAMCTHTFQFQFQGFFFEVGCLVRLWTLNKLKHSPDSISIAG